MHDTHAGCVHLYSVVPVREFSTFSWGENCTSLWELKCNSLKLRCNLGYKISILVLHQLFKDESQLTTFESQIAMRYKQIPGLCSSLWIWVDINYLLQRVSGSSLKMYSSPCMITGRRRRKTGLSHYTDRKNISTSCNILEYFPTAGTSMLVVLDVDEAR